MDEYMDYEEVWKLVASQGNFMLPEPRPARPISGGAIAPLAMILLPLLPQLIDSAIKIYESIAEHPTTPEASAAVIRQYVTNIREINARIQAAPLPGDE